MNIDNYRRNCHLRQHGLKYCSSCERELPLEQFRRNGVSRHHYCIPCQNRYQADWLTRKMANNPDFAAQIRNRDRQAKRAKYAEQMKDPDAYQAMLERKRIEKNARMAALRADPVAHAAWKARSNALKQASRARVKAAVQAAEEAAALAAAQAAEEAAALAAAQAAARAEAERIAAEERAMRFAAAQAFATDRRIEERIVILKRRADYPMLIAQAKAAHQRAIDRRQIRQEGNNG